MSAIESFRTELIDPFEYTVPEGTTLTYPEYMSLPPTERSDDEASVVDRQITMPLLSWLGYGAADYIYNQSLPGQPDRPDFVVRPLGPTAFVVEDKNTTEELTKSHLEQLQGYVAGTQGYCLWCNGRRILALRFDAMGSYRVLVDVSIEGAFGRQLAIFPQDSAFDLLRMLFNKERFTTIEGLLGRICISEDQWRAQAQPLTSASLQKAFIEDTRGVLEKLAIAARGRLESTVRDVTDLNSAFEERVREYESIVEDLIRGLQGRLSVDDLDELRRRLLGLKTRLADLDEHAMDPLRPRNLAPEGVVAWEARVKSILLVSASIREQNLMFAESRRIWGAYLVWKERYGVIEEPSTNEEDRVRAYSEQLAHVFLVRLLLARILEDKGAIPRIVSDGGFAAWRDLLRGYFGTGSNEIRGSSLVGIVYQKVSNYYQQFFQQPVFDWFAPDDFLLAQVLERLNLFDLSGISSDLIGYTYESYIDRTARNRKGHFLTRPEVVDYMLDRADYRGTEIIGRRLLDPACGSGSFLVHAAKRLREGLREAVVRDAASGRTDQTEASLAHQFIDHVQTDLVGLDINPFSCYLAQLNLFVQALDDVLLLWARGEDVSVARFSIHNTNSLDLPRHVLYKQEGTLGDDEHVGDEATEIKSEEGEFQYVVSNPPYINRGIVAGARSYFDIPFYEEILHGDSNTYLLFLRLAQYFVSPGGRICFIVPLNLFGDKSSRKAREIFASDTWTITSLTRFYSRRMLFPGVLQGVCVLSVVRQEAPEGHEITVFGGDDTRRAAANSISVAKAACTSNVLDSFNDSWYKSWMVVTPAEAYEVWDAIKQVVTTDVEAVIGGKLDASQGDVNATYVNPFRVPRNRDTVPLTKGSCVTDYGTWHPADWLDPRVTVPRAARYRSASTRARQEVLRVAGLSEQETVILLKEVSGLEMIRPIRGTTITRSASDPVVADHTLLSIHTTAPQYESLAYAIFAVLTSALGNYVLGLFSTNAHVAKAEVLRTPLPPVTEEVLTRLSAAARDCVDSGSRLEQWLHGHGGWTDNSEVFLPFGGVLRAAPVGKITLGDAVMQGLIEMRGSERFRVGTLLGRDELIIGESASHDFSEAASALLEESQDVSWVAGLTEVRLPDSEAAGQFLQIVRTKKDSGQRMYDQLQAAVAEIDEVVFEWFGITDESYKQLILAGMPWARGAPPWVHARTG